MEYFLPIRKQINYIIKIFLTKKSNIYFFTILSGAVFIAAQIPYLNLVFNSSSVVFILCITGILIFGIAKENLSKTILALFLMLYFLYLLGGESKAENMANLVFFLMVINVFQYLIDSCIKK